jgi:hypothetical protein
VDQSSLTKSKFHTYFDGTEFIIAGKVVDKALPSNTLGGRISSTYYEVMVPEFTNTDEIPEKRNPIKAGKYLTHLVKCRCEINLMESPKLLVCHLLEHNQ